MTTTTKTATPATPAKLRNGSWGARVPGTAHEGQAITIRAKSGKTWDATVSRVLWSGQDSRSGQTVSLCATESGRTRTRSRGTWTGCHCGSVEEYERAGDCAHCRHDRY